MILMLSMGSLQMKDICAREFSTTPDQLCVIFSGKILSDSDTLVDAGVRDGSSLHLVIKSAHRVCTEIMIFLQKYVIKYLIKNLMEASNFLPISE
jgi:Ubiquitin family